VRGPIAKGRPRSALLAALLAALALSACGGSGGGDSSSAEAQAPAGEKTADAGPGAGPAGAASKSASASAAGSSSSSPSAAGAGSPAAPPLTRASARRAERQAEARQAARHRALAKRAGKAAPFLVSSGDNSIPTYGSEASGSQRAAAEQALSGYLAARAEGDWQAACSLMSASVTKQLALLAGEADGGKPSCAAAYAKLSERAPASARADPLIHGLASLRVESPHAFALFYGPGSQQYMMPLEDEGGAWKVTQIAPVAWPIGAPSQSSP
jgi:hypothetical protein